MHRIKQLMSALMCAIFLISSGAVGHQTASATAANCSVTQKTVTVPDAPTQSWQSDIMNNSGTTASYNTIVAHADPTQVQILGYGFNQAGQVTSAAGTGSYNSSSGDYTFYWNSNRNNASVNWTNYWLVKPLVSFANLQMTFKVSDEIFASGSGTPQNLVNCANNFTLNTTTPPGPQAPVAPTLTGTAGNQQTTLSWNSVSGATSYTLYKAGTAIYSGTATTYTNTGLTNGQTYSYTVTATGAGGTSPASNTVVLTPPLPPDAPTLSGVAGDKQVNLSWTTPNGATGYTITRDGTQIYQGTATSYTDTGLTNGIAHTYVVYASNVSGSGANSNALTLSAMSAASTISDRDIQLVSMGLAGYISVQLIKPFRWRGND